MGILRLSSTPRVMRHMYADTRRYILGGTVCTSYLTSSLLGAVTLCDVSSLVTQHQGLLFYKQYDVRCSQIRSRPSRSAMNFNPGTALMSEIRPADVSRSKCCYITVYQCPSVVVDSPVSPELPGVLLVRISSVKREKGSRKAHDWSPSHPGSATGSALGPEHCRVQAKVQAIIGVGAMEPTAECRNLPYHQTELLHSALHQ